MAHFAKIDENGIVIDVQSVANQTIQDSEGVEQESLGVAFLNKVHKTDDVWVQTSYNSNIRKQYAGIGYTYDTTNDVFIISKPYDSWTLNSNFDWEAPVAYPTDHKFYIWNEDNQTWDEHIPDQPFNSWTWNEPTCEWQAPTLMPTDGQPYEWNENTQTWDLIA